MLVEYIPLDGLSIFVNLTVRLFDDIELKFEEKNRSKIVYDPLGLGETDRRRHQMDLNQQRGRGLPALGCLGTQEGITC